ncbi:hybrid sensor histidine kinase/response regulator [Burkholderia pyrrocinia]|uniref:hybrid sensor histidine kinase/response regulator n=1 Tax=Burkholderia pyrrocinia TaxID=60550 RepID=UPI001589004E|nr:hybrid sensor histidine kinase/response regulator [Burkholderia pyrrocinia]
MTTHTHDASGPDIPAPPGPSTPASEPGVLNRYQRTLLYGGGAIVTVILVTVLAVVLQSLVKDYVADRAAEFGIRKTLLQLELLAREGALRVGIMHEESVWSLRPAPAPALMNEFASQQGRIVLQGNRNFDPLLVLGDITPRHPASSFAPYLALADEFSYRVGAYTKVQGRSLSGYLYSPDARFIAIVPAPKDGDPLKLNGVANTAALLQRIAPDLGDLRDPVVTAQLLAARNPIWLPPSIDPFSHKPVIRLVQPGFDHGKPFIVFVSDLPVDLLRSRLASGRHDEVSMIVDAPGQLILSTEQPLAEDGLTAAVRRIALPKWNGKQADLHYRSGFFVLRDQISAAGWRLVYAFSWRTIVAELWPRLAGYTAAMLFAISVLWTFLILLDRKVFTPGYQRSQRVFESENLNRTMVSTAPSGLVLLSFSSGAILLQNDVMHTWAASADPMHAPLHLQLLRRYQAAAHADAWEGDLDPPLACTDGSTLDLHVSAIRTKYQGVDVLLCNITDVTARRNTERALEEARTAADAANRAKSTFLATISHEIRTPLNAILGHLELLDRSALTTAQSRRLHTVMSSSSALLGIINDILDLSKVESGQMTVETIPFDLAALTRSVVAALAPIAQAKGVRLETMIADSLAPQYMGDPTRVRQIMVNLVGNAIKFTEVGEVLLEVYAQDEERSDSPIVIGVVDTGIGMTQAQQQNLFQEFSQADPSIARRFGGTGLGLSLSRKLAALLGGTIDFSSEAGVGSTFVVTLPIPAHAGLATGTPPVPTMTALPDAAPVAAGSVLVVDDHPVNRDLIRDQLEILGYDADVAADGLAALRCFSERHYDIVMTDLNMPGMDGYMLARCLRDRGALVPIVAITAHATEHERRLCEQAGINDVLLKPMSLGSIDAAIRQQVGQPGATRAAALPAEADPSRGVLPEDVHARLLEALGKSVEAIRRAHASNDTQSLLDQLHSVKGAFAMIHETTVADLCGQLEALGHLGKRDAIMAALPELEQLAGSRLERRRASPSESGLT